jgi:hypothetical protein
VRNDRTRLCTAANLHDPQRSAAFPRSSGCCPAEHGRLHPTTLNLCDQGSLEERHGNDQSIAAPLAKQQSLNSLKRAFTNTYALPDLQVRIRLRDQTGCGKLLDRGHLRRVHRLRVSAAANDSDNARHREDRKQNGRIKAAKNISGEQRNLACGSLRMLAGPAERQTDIKSSAV